MKNIIFDLGGVILKLDQARTVNALKELSPHPQSDFESEIRNHPIHHQFESGKASEGAFRDFLLQFLSLENSGGQYESQIDLAWNAMLVEFPKQNIEILALLKKRGYPLALLSNTNPIHLRRFASLYEESTGKPYSDFEALFEGRLFYSHEMNTRKPNLDAYQKVTAATGFDPAETLFLDDSKENIQGAKAAGLLVRLSSLADMLTLPDSLESPTD